MADTVSLATMEAIQSRLMQCSKRLDPKNPGVVARFYKPVFDESAQRILRFEDRSQQQCYRDKVIRKAKKSLEGLIGEETSACHDESAIEIGSLRHTGIGNLAILRASHDIYHETSIALYHCLSYRKLFVRTYGVFTANILTRFPKPLPCCGYGQQKWIKPACRIHKAGWYRPLGSVLFFLGATDLKIALQRRWSFEEFITILAKDQPLHIYKLSIVVTENWKANGFDERQLIKCLFTGAFEFLGVLNFRGFTAEERDLIDKLIHERRLPNVRIERGFKG